MTKTFNKSIEEWSWLQKTVSSLEKTQTQQIKKRVVAKVDARIS